MSVVVLPSNRPAARFYRGGRRIADFRGEPPPGGFEPEDWVGSVTAVSGEAPAGMSVLADGVLLADAIAADPPWWLGPAHVAAFGADPMLLVKLLDAGQRLPVHAHPDGAWAAANLSAAHGKTEAWYILSPGEVRLGLARELHRDELAGLVATQDVPSILGAMHRVDVGPGDVVHVPAGMLHAIGEGILLIELQEPEDLSILVEWTGYAIDGPSRGHLGVGFERALGAVETRRRPSDEIDALIHRAGSSTALLPTDAAAFFRLERLVIAGSAVIDPGFAVLVVLGGAVTLTTDAAADATAVAAGSTLLVPHAAGAVTVSGAGEILVCRPPSPR